MNAERTEKLLKQMRGRALLMAAHPSAGSRQVSDKELRDFKTEQLKRVEDLKKLYFNAGRWAGGARDRVARKAFEKVNSNELRA